MTSMLKPDVCVIGAGWAGFSVATAAVAAGLSVVLVDRNEIGSARLSTGPVALQAVAAVARQVTAMRRGSEFGLADVEPEVDFRKLGKHIGKVIAAVAPNLSAERLAALGVRVIRAEARFKDRRAVIAGDFEVRARRFVIATGSMPALPAIDGLGTVDHYTSRTILGLTRRPGHLVVLGGEPAAIEFAQAYRRLGSDVTLIEPAAALAGHDPEMAAVVLRRLRAEGVTILENMKVNGIERVGKKGVRLDVMVGTTATSIEGTHLLLMAGRAPDIAGLDLDKAGIARGAAGISVSPALRTANRRVYAVGEVTGAPPFVHVAEHHAACVMRNLAGAKEQETRTIFPRVVFTDPELAQIGQTEAEAAGRHRGIRILRWPYAENLRAQAERRTEGHIKVLVDHSGRVLGATIAGADAGEMIGSWALAMANNLNIGDIGGAIMASSTLGEIGKRAAIAYFVAAAPKSFARKLLRALRVFG